MVQFIVDNLAAAAMELEIAAFLLGLFFFLAALWAVRNDDSRCL